MSTPSSVAQNAQAQDQNQAPPVPPPDPVKMSQDIFNLQSLLQNLVEENAKSLIPQIIAAIDQIRADCQGFAPNRIVEFAIFTMIASHWFLHPGQRRIIVEFLAPLNYDMYDEAVYRFQQNAENSSIFCCICDEAIEALFNQRFGKYVNKWAADDELETIQDEIASMVDFDKKKKVFEIPMIIAALFGSIKVFKYLYLNGISPDPQSLTFATIIGGNYEIIHLVEGMEQCAEFFKDERAKQLALIADRNDIYDWLDMNYNPNPVEDYLPIQFFNFEIFLKLQKSRTKDAEKTLELIQIALGSGNIIAAIILGFKNEPMTAPNFMLIDMFNLIGADLATEVLNFFKILANEDAGFVLEDIDEQCAFIEWVFKHGAKPFCRTIDDKIILHILINNGKASNEALKYYLQIILEEDKERTEDILNETFNGRTILQEAVRARADPNKIIALIKAGAIPNFSDKKGHTIFYHLLDMNARNTGLVLELLEKFEGKLYPEPNMPALLRVMAENGILGIFTYYIEHFEVDLSRSDIQEELHKVHPSTGNEVMEYLEKNKLLKE